MLLGRELEKETLGGLIAAMRRGISGALVLHGDAGMGKTALLEYAAELADDVRVSRISGVEAESDFPFAALHRLLYPFMGDAARIPSGQRDALDSAFGLVDRAPADLFLVGLATLSLLAELAGGTGMVCTIDDAQWIDPESLKVLGFVARRLDAEGVALVFGSRSSPVSLAGLAGVPSLEIGGLSESAASDLISRTVKTPLNAMVTRRITTETSGCPLALIELADELSAGQWLGADPLSEPIPISHQLELHFRHLVDALPRDTQTFLLVAAAETSGEPQLVRQVALDLGCGVDAEATATDSRLLIMGPSIEFRHPLIRSAVYAGSSGSDRRRVHLALANAIDREIDPDRRARHLAAIALGPDPQLADDLAAAAGRARDRGGYAAEASLLARSADLTTGPTLRSRRLISAAAAALKSGSAAQADELLARARQGLSDPLLSAEVQAAYGRLRVPMFQPAEAPAALLSAARQFESIDVKRARESLLEAFDASIVTRHMAVGTNSTEIAEVALATRRPSDSDVQLTDALLDAFATLCGVGFSEAVPELRAAGRRLTEGSISSDECARWYMFGTVIANELLDDRMYAAWVARVQSESRRTGALAALQYILIGAAETELRLGRLTDAEAHFSEVRGITQAIGSPGTLYESARVTLQAWRGDRGSTRDYAETMIGGGTAIGSAGAVLVGYHALAILELGAGNYREALSAASYAVDHRAVGWVSQMLPLVIEAASRCGEKSVAERALGELNVRAIATGTPWALGLLERSRALLAGDEEAGRHFQQAVAWFEQSSMAVELAWTHLVYGEWMRRCNRRAAARDHLRMAYEFFSTRGIAGFAERARIELQATGEQVRRRTPEVRNELTAQELHIARLASLGATNPEIAAQVFLSSSTVDYHLRKVFRKLDIGSRRQLQQVLPN